MISYDKVSLSTCAFGAGIAHVAALALVLPLLVTLPAPRTPPRLVYIPVTIMPKPEALAPVAPDDAIGALIVRASVAEVLPVLEPEPIAASSAPAPAPSQAEEATVEASDEVTGALPEPMMTAEATDPAAQAAGIDADLDPPPLPKRVRRDAAGDAILAVPAAPPPAPAQAAPPPPRRAISSPATPRRRTVTKDVAPYQGSWEALLGKPVFKPVDKRGQ